MPAVKIEKNVEMQTSFENGQRNGGGKVYYYARTGKVNIWCDDSNEIEMSAKYLDSLTEALVSLSNAINREGK